ncbi:alpha/beta-hydrolase [Tothia fuscella]|uniref:Alpha/beta-hydrolase n=1 Tax=Tothia fuscella TaxID=1048955 RepID=A0A9P4NMM7_9PEZI|nr:alpha/beta-hydrolase [Tothia fuscella]
MVDSTTQSSRSEDSPKPSTLAYPDPTIIPPTTAHTHTIIILHGRGSNGAFFAEPFLSSQTSSGRTLRQHFPGVKWIFPTAKKRRAAAFNRATINQWFDLWDLHDQENRKELQYEGIRETTAFLHHLITEEARLVGLNNVVLGGLSQGCAMMLHAALSYQHDPHSSGGKGVSFGGFFGMSGWLPFADDILNVSIAAGQEEDGDDDFFDFEDGDTDNNSDSTSAAQLRAANLIRDIADLPVLGSDLTTTTLPFVTIPILLGHATDDEKVPIQLGEQARDVLMEIGLDVTWRSYDFGHWYKVPDQIDDIVDFLREKVGLVNVEDAEKI